MTYDVNSLQRRAAPRSFTGPSNEGRKHYPMSPLTQPTSFQGGGAGGNSPAAGKAKPKKQSALSKYLGTDVDYKNTINDLTRNFQGFQTQNLTNKGNLLQDFNDTKIRLGKDQDQARERMEADYAARGMFGSGLFQDANNDQNLQYQNQFGDANVSYNRNLSQLLTDLANSKSLFEQQKKDAKLSAIRRRAEKFGIRK